MRAIAEVPDELGIRYVARSGEEDRSVPAIVPCHGHGKERTELHRGDHHRRAVDGLARGDLAIVAGELGDHFQAGFVCARLRVSVEGLRVTTRAAIPEGPDEGGGITGTDGRVAELYTVWEYIGIETGLQLVARASLTEAEEAGEREEGGRKGSHVQVVLVR